MHFPEKAAVPSFDQVLWPSGYWWLWGQIPAILLLPPIRLASPAGTAP